MTFSEIVKKIRSFRSLIVEITGGEPLLQNETLDLIKIFHGLGFQILLETNGARSVAKIPSYVHVIMDVKCPGSGMTKYINYDNFKHLKKSDEIKFVIKDKKDFLFASKLIAKYHLERISLLSFSPVLGHCTPKKLATWLLGSKFFARLQLQQHKLIWGPNRRGV